MRARVWLALSTVLLMLALTGVLATALTALTVLRPSKYSSLQIVISCTVLIVISMVILVVGIRVRSRGRGLLISSYPSTFKRGSKWR